MEILKKNVLNGECDNDIDDLISKYSNGNLFFDSIKNPISQDNFKHIIYSDIGLQVSEDGNYIREDITLSTVDLYNKCKDIIDVIAETRSKINKAIVSETYIIC